MSHPFFKTAKVTEGTPSRLSQQSYERITKKAHEIWEVDGSADEPEAIRKRQETAKIDYDAPATEMSVGDLVIFLLGGRMHTGRIATLRDTETLEVRIAGQEQSLYLPSSMVTKAE